MSEQKSKLRIVSDGTGHGTSIKVDGCDLELALYVRSIEWKLNGNGFADVSLVLASHTIDCDLIGEIRDVVADSNLRDKETQADDTLAGVLMMEDNAVHQRR